MAAATQTETSAATQAEISYEEFLERTDENQHVEWVDGEVVEMSPISDRHEDLSGFLKPPLRLFVEAHQLGIIRGEPFQMKPTLSLPGRAPDFSLWRRPIWIVSGALIWKAQQTWSSRLSARRAGRETGATSFLSTKPPVSPNTG